MKTKDQISRRDMLKSSAAVAAFTIVPRNVLGGQGHIPPSEKLNVAGIGVGGMGTGDIRQAASQNVVALCDVDQRALARNAKVFPKAELYTDFRKMLETHKEIDAVMVATPDHNHAVVSLMAMKMGKHVHCQKPLTHSVYEARLMYKTAKEAKVATQMGNQGQASENARLISETIWSGAIGTVREVHAGSNRFPPISPRGIARPKGTPAVPSYLNWDLWLGGAAERPYHPTYHPFSWRGWWDFGTGVLGDIGCHQLSAVFKALKLGHPASVEASSSNNQLKPEIANETAPGSSITRWHFPTEGDRAAVDITWWDGGLKPPRPDELEPGRAFAEGDWLLVVGDKGKMYGHRIIPESRGKEIGKPPRVLSRSPGHYKEWFEACKGGPAAGSDFVNHAAHLAEVVLLGNIAIRTNEKLLWDGPDMRFTNSEAANQLINPPYRSGWEL
ncbi:MAG TPA: Gfo/Idh/MocA family oxidoreductase [Verrucomicrobiales bacterium]|nr:Gfo/Idh/MocA family oxidoreductase [Verrucomicrobiales bacterium]HIL83116.1 Gfo/Idh/MocA family oxidoreductase [Pseudomonadales bacterium]